MDIDTYESIICAISKKTCDFDKALTELVEEFPGERKESVRSILSQEHQKHIKKGFKACNNEGRKAAVYRSVKRSIADGEPGGAIVRLAQDAGDSSVLTARMVLEEYLTENTENTVRQPGEYKDQALKHTGRMFKTASYRNVLRKSAS